MPKVFISYRRDDSAYPAQQIYETLVEKLGQRSVFFDVASIPVGSNFRQYLDEQVSQCDVLLAVIGDNWLRILNERRDDPLDTMRIEIELALKKGIHVVPVLVGKATFPNEKELAGPISQLSNIHAAEVRVGKDYKLHLQRLINGLELLFSDSSNKREQKSIAEITQKSTTDSIQDSEDKWHEDYELLDEIVNVPALPKQLFDVLLSRSAYTSTSPIEWYVKIGDYVKKGQVIGKLHLRPNWRARIYSWRYHHLKLNLNGDQTNIRSPIYGKIYEFGQQHTTYYRRSLPTENATRYDYGESILRIQKIKGPDKKESTGDYSKQNFIKPFEHVVKSWLRFQDKKLQDWYKIPTIEYMQWAEIRTEPISYNEKFYAFIEKDEKLEPYAYYIPFPSAILLEAATKQQDYEEKIHIKVGQWVEKGDIIVSYDLYDNTSCIRVPISGKVIFTGLDYDKILSLITDSADDSRTTTWSEEENWPLDIYYNKRYGVARTVLVMIQPRKGCVINPCTYIEEAYRELVDAAKDYINNYPGLSANTRNEYRPIVEKEIQKLKKCEGRIVGDYRKLK